MTKKTSKNKKSTTSSSSQKKSGKKQDSHSDFHSLEGKDRHLLKEVIDKALACIEKIQTKEMQHQKKIDDQQKKLFSSKNESDRLEHSFAIEGLKIEAFSQVEKEYQALSPLLDEAYLYADRIGGIIRDDFLQVCRTLSKGINLELMQKGLKKIKVDLGKHLLS